MRYINVNCLLILSCTWTPYLGGVAVVYATFAARSSIAIYISSCVTMQQKPPLGQCNHLKKEKNKNSLEENLTITTIHCNLAIVRKYIDKLFWLSNGDILLFWTTRNQNLLVDNQDDLYINILIMNRNGQVTTFSCNEQVFF